MPKPKGLPQTFDIRVPDRPVQIGDYLDEELRRPPETAAVPPRPLTVPRKQVNMTPETLRMVDELLFHLRQHSRERDIRASELFHALVLSVYEIRDELDLSGIQPRGRWGSKTATELPLAIKEAFQDAIARARKNG
jgi:hypothetical protein